MRQVIVNPRSVCSLGLDSNIGAPPPGYTSQRDTNSSIAMINEYEDYNGEAISNCSSSPPPPSMESRRDVLDPMYTLPSPYSIEDLPLVESMQPPVVSHEQNHDPPHRSQTPSCPHGYTHTHSQCTPVSSSFKVESRSNPDIQHNPFPPTTPVRSSSYYPPQQHQYGVRHVRDAPDFYGPPILSTDNLSGASVQSRSSLRPYHLSPGEEHPPILRASNPYPHQRRETTLPSTAVSSNDLSSSPYTHNIYPPRADIRIMTYPPADEVAHEFDRDYEECEYEEDGEGDLNGGRSPLNEKNMSVMMMMNSTATILSPSDEPSNYHSQNLALSRSPPHHRHPSLLNGISRENTTLGHKQAVTTTARNIIGTGNMNLTKTATKSNSRNSTKPSAKDDPFLTPLPTQKPTNYVHLSRKCSPSKPTSKFWGWRKTPPTQISSITGTFIINPELNISPGLLNAMEDPVFRSSSSDTENTLQSRISRTGNRRTNLRLEVENGGIDVDIRLSPSISPSGGACIENKDRGHPDTFCDVDAMMRVQVSASTTTIAFNDVGNPSAEACEKPTQQSPHPHLSSPSPTKRVQMNPDQSTTKRKEAILKPAVAQRTSSTRDKKQSRPTTIHLRIKQAHGVKTPQSDSVRRKPSTGPVPFALIARIHAPNPRPPFHLFASTIDIPKSTPDSIAIAKQTSKEPQLPTHEKENQPRVSSSIPIATSILNNEASGFTPDMNPPRRIRRSLSKSHRSHPQSVSSLASTPPNFSSQFSFASPLYLHLPRTFHGPVTIHISSGNVGAHLRLSEELEREMALIRESEFGRGYFVGVLGSDVDVDGGKDENRKGERERDGGEERLGSGGGDNDTIFIHPDENGARGTNNNPIVDHCRHHPLEQDHDHEPVEIENKTQLHNPNNNNNINQAAPSDDSSVSSSLILPPSLSSLGKAEWCGDRIGVRVGSGEVYLQFEDEVDPFSINSRREVGFWKRRLGCLGCFF